MTDAGLLAGKIALVTGAGSGIGRRSAEVFAEHGATVIALDIDNGGVASTVEGLTPVGSHLAITADVSSADSVRAAFSTIDTHLGGLDVLFHCAGLWRPTSDGPIAEVSDGVWDEIVDVNLKGTFLLCREAVPRIAARGGGAIVTVASTAALIGWEKLNAYSASKGGVVALSRAMAAECAPLGIRVNCVCPGVIETPMTSRTLAHSKPKDLLLGRLGQPEDIARAGLFLASNWASYITGTTLAVDGGATAV